MRNVVAGTKRRTEPSRSTRYSPAASANRRPDLSGSLGRASSGRARYHGGGSLLPRSGVGAVRAVVGRGRSVAAAAGVAPAVGVRGAGVVATGAGAGSGPRRRRAAPIATAVAQAPTIAR